MDICKKNENKLYSVCTTCSEFILTTFSSSISAISYLHITNDHSKVILFTLFEGILIMVN